MSLQHIADRKEVYIYPFYIADIVATKQIKEISPFVVKEILNVIEHDTISWNYDLDSGKQVGEYFLEKIIHDKKFFPHVMRQIYAKSEALGEYCKKIRKIKNLDTAANERLVSLFFTYIEKLIDLRVWGWIPGFLDGLDESFLSNRLAAELKDFLRLKGLENKTAEYNSVLSSSDKMSSVRQEELARVRLLRTIQKTIKNRVSMEYICQEKIELLQKKFPSVYIRILKHAKRYGWLTYGYSGPAMTTEHLLSLMAQNLQAKESISNQVKGIKTYYSSLKKEKNKLQKDLQIPPRLQFLFRVSSELMYLKDFRKGIFQDAYLVMDAVLLEMAKRMNITLREIKFLVHTEIADALLRNNIKKYGSLAKERANGQCCFYVVDGEITIRTGSACKEFIAKKLQPKNLIKQSVGEPLKGMVAYKGKVVGQAKIVLVKEDIHKVQDGDILVSSSTNPDLLLAMKKAGAFVTDMGGIISHAAIVSRELKKPCVVGTKYATQRICDNDTVEVDADQGIVTILKKAV